MTQNQNGTLVCCVVMEWLNSQRSVLRKVVCKSATLRLIRNERREIFLEIESDKNKQKHLLNGISVHKKFMSEGKASINFSKENMVLLISNAPPASLLGFLKVMYIKMSGKEETKLDPRERLLAMKNKGVDEISPITLQELKDAKVKAKIPDTTPTGSGKKRPLGDKSNGTGVNKHSVKKLCVAPNNLTKKQRDVLDAALSGVSLFFTGSAGTGKSFLLRRIIAALPPDVTMATASTGVAACLIGGTTLHSFAGIGKGSASIERCIELASRPACRAIWRNCRHLVIDEISMIDGEYFEKLERIARAVRNNDKPFGGIQLILCGDFFQLAPVCRDASAMAKRFCFSTPAWDKCIQKSFELEIVHRQKDRAFVDILQSIRMGCVTPEITSTLLETSNRTVERDGILATRLCSHTADSHLINTNKLEQLEGKSKTFKAIDSMPELSQTMDLQTPVLGLLELKIGAQVMLVKNSNVGTGLVNGARGVVISFNSDGLPVVRFRSNLQLAVRNEKWTVKMAGGGVVTRQQIPLKLAWAFSIHKSQGLTLDCVEMSLARVFEAGQAYVALSRAQSLETLRVLDFDPKQVWANSDVTAFYKKLRRRMESIEYIPLGLKKTSNIKKRPVKHMKSLMARPLMNVH